MTTVPHDRSLCRGCLLLGNSMQPSCPVFELGVHPGLPLLGSLSLSYSASLLAGLLGIFPPFSEDANVPKRFGSKQPGHLHSALPPLAAFHSRLDGMPRLPQPLLYPAPLGQESQCELLPSFLEGDEACEVQHSSVDPDQAIRNEVSSPFGFSFAADWLGPHEPRLISSFVALKPFTIAVYKVAELAQFLFSLLHDLPETISNLIRARQSALEAGQGGQISTSWSPAAANGPLVGERLWLD